MERAGRLLSKSKTGRKLMTREEIAVASWPAAIGARLSRKTRAVRLEGDTLIVEVEDDLWRRNLAALEPQIVKKFTGVLEAGIAPRRIEFRLGVPRRPMQRAEPAKPAHLDEAERIADPVLSYLYRQSRRKAGA